MNRLALIPSALVLALALAACPPDKPKPPPVQADTTPLNMDSLKTAIPPAAPDTFKRVVPKVLPPPAPPALVEAVKREQSFTQFCYQEFGQKSDPTLKGGVAMVVTMGKKGIEDAKVVDDSWSARGPGRAVNACLNEKAAQAWKPDPAALKPGDYVVQLTFRPS